MGENSSRHQCFHQNSYISHWVAVVDCRHQMYSWKDAKKSVGLMTSLDNIKCHVIDKNHLFDEADQIKQCVTNMMPGDWQENKTSTLRNGMGNDFPSSSEIWHAFSSHWILIIHLKVSSINAPVGRMWMRTSSKDKRDYHLSKRT